MEVLRIVYRVEISFDITKDFVPESEASGISRAVEKVKTLNDQMEANLKALNVAVWCCYVLLIVSFVFDFVSLSLLALK